MIAWGWLPGGTVMHVLHWMPGGKEPACNTLGSLRWPTDDEPAAWNKMVEERWNGPTGRRVWTTYEGSDEYPVPDLPVCSRCLKRVEDDWVAVRRRAVLTGS